MNLQKEISFKKKTAILILITNYKLKYAFFTFPSKKYSLF